MTGKKNIKANVSLTPQEIYKEVCPACKQKLIRLYIKRGAEQSLEAQVKALLEKQPEK